MNRWAGVWVIGVLIFSSSVFSASDARAQSFLDLVGLSPYAQYQTFQTPHFNLIYQKGYFNFAERAATHLEHAHEVLSPILKWQPRQRTDILIVDNTDSANGLTSPALRIGIVLYATPPDAWFETAETDDWIKLLVFHEYTHLLNIDPTTEWMEGLRWFFGDIIRPNGLWPIWMLEGLAVYFETRTSRSGRGRSPYFDAVLRAFIEEHRLGTSDNFGMTLDRVNGPFAGFPGGDIHYLFGYELWRQMTKHYPDVSKAESDMGELSIRSSARVPYFIEGNQQNVTGQNWTDVWDQFVSSTHERLDPQIEQIKKSGVTEFDAHTDADFEALGGALSPDGQWLAYNKTSTQRRPGLYLQDLKTRAEFRVDDKSQGVGIAFTPNSKEILYSALHVLGTYQAFSDLFSYSLESKQITQLTQGLRLKDPALSPDGTQVVAIKVQRGTHTLWTGKLTHDSNSTQIGDFHVVYRPADFTILGTPKYLSARKIIFSEQNTGKNQSDLKILDLDKNEVLPLLADGAMNRSLDSRDGAVVFVSDQSGVEDLCRLDFTTERIKSTPLTHVVTGTALPVIAANGDLWASVLTSHGYQIGQFNHVNLKTRDRNEGLAQYPTAILAHSAPALNAPPPLDSALAPPTDLHLTESQTQDYSPWSSLVPRQWAPVGYLNYSSVSGAMIAGTVLGFDSTGKHQYDGYLGYHFLSNTVDPYLSYTYYGFRPNITATAASTTTNIATDSYGLDYNQNNLASLSFSFPVRWTYSSLTPAVSFAEEWNGLYTLANHTAISSNNPDYNHPQISTIGASLTFTSAESSAFGFIPERGDDFYVATQGRQYSNDYTLWKYLISYDHRFPIADHAVLIPKARWLASTLPMSGFNNFYALDQGKNSNDPTDRGTNTSLSNLGIRGYLQNAAFITRASGVGSVDFHFPLAQLYQGNGTLPVFVKQIHGFVFFDTIYIPSVTYGDLFLPSFGGGLSMDTTLLIRAPITFNIEYQNGTRPEWFGQQLVFLSVSSTGLF